MQDLRYQLERQAQRAIRAENAICFWQKLAIRRGRIVAGLICADVFFFFYLFIRWCFE